MVSVMALIFALTLGYSYRSRNERLESIRANDYESWIKAAEDFIVHNPVSRYDPEEYNSKVKPLWEKIRLNRFNGNEDWEVDHAAHPEVALQKLLEMLYQESKATNSLIAQMDTKKWLGIVRKFHQHNKEEEVDTGHGARAQILYNILLGRIFNRLAVDCVKVDPAVSNKRCPDIIHSYQHFNTALKQIDANNSDGVRARYDSYRSAVSNGLGTVYATSVTLFLLDEDYQINDVERLPCENAGKCLSMAIDSYEESVLKFKEDSFEMRRKNNNFTDLLIKVGENYRNFDKYILQLDQKHLEIFDKKEDLIRHLEKNAEKLINTIDKDNSRVMHLICVTVAQAYATMIRLMTDDKILADNQPRNDGQIVRFLDSAVTYLKLAALLDRSNLKNWDMKPFCFVYNDEYLKSEYIKKVRSDFMLFRKLVDLEPDKPGSPISIRLCQLTS